MGSRGPDDYRPDWYVLAEQVFELLMKGAAALIWVWGLGIFLLVLWGLWALMFR